MTDLASATQHCAESSLSATASAYLPAMALPQPGSRRIYAPRVLSDSIDLSGKR